jgi:hypothetical protein
MPAEHTLTAPWQNLLATAEKNAAIISNEVINDAVLGKSVTAAVSPYFAQADTTAFLREEFAKADEACRAVRAKAADVMQAFGLAQDWGDEDLNAADPDLWQELNRVTDHAATVNRKRLDAQAHKAELFANAIDVIDTCSGIATLRHLKEFRCEGDAFCTAYVAALSIADCRLHDRQIDQSQWDENPVRLFAIPVGFENSIPRLRYLCRQQNRRRYRQCIRHSEHQRTRHRVDSGNQEECQDS